MKKVNEKKAVKAEKKVSKSETRRSAVQKKPATKAVKPVKKAISEDEAAFDKFLEKYDANLSNRCGRNKLYGIYQAGIKRGKAAKK